MRAQRVIRCLLLNLRWAEHNIATGLQQRLAGYTSTKFCTAASSRTRSQCHLRCSVQCLQKATHTSSDAVAKRSTTQTFRANVRADGHAYRRAVAALRRSAANLASSSIFRAARWAGATYCAPSLLRRGARLSWPSPCIRYIWSYYRSPLPHRQPMVRQVSVALAPN